MAIRQKDSADQPNPPTYPNRFGTDLWEIAFKQYISKMADEEQILTQASARVSNLNPDSHFINGTINVKSRHGTTRIFLEMSARYSVTLYYNHPTPFFRNQHEFYRNFFLTCVWGRFNDLYSILASQSDVRVPKLASSRDLDIKIEFSPEAED